MSFSVLMPVSFFEFVMMMMTMTMMMTDHAAHEKLITGKPLEVSVALPLVEILIY